MPASGFTIGAPVARVPLPSQHDRVPEKETAGTPVTLDDDRQAAYNGGVNGTDTIPWTWRLGCLWLLATPFVAIRASSFVRGMPVLVNPTWWPWINGGTVLVSLYLLLAPFFIESALRKQAAVKAPGGAEGLLLLMGVGGAGAVSMMPVVLLVIGSGSVSWVFPCAAISFVVAMFWCLRFRRLLF